MHHRSTVQSNSFLSIIRMIHSRFEALGSYLPETRVTTKKLISQMQFVPPFDLESITGIEERRMRSTEEDSFTIALAAAQDALKKSRYQPSELDLIVSCSICRIKDQTNNYWEPSFALFLAEQLGAKKAIHFDISNACAGMMTGVYIADRMIKSSMIQNALVVSGECNTPISETAVQEIDSPIDSQFASLTVGDAGAAVILDRSENTKDQIHEIELMTCAEYSHLCIGKPSEKNGGPAMYTNNREMHKEERILLWPTFQNDFLQQKGLNFESEHFDYVIHHQVGTRAMENFSKYSEPIFNAKIPENLSCVEHIGNTASTSHFVVLHEYLKQNRIPKGSKILFIPAASGLVTGFVSATISSLEA